MTRRESDIRRVMRKSTRKVVRKEKESGSVRLREDKEMCSPVALAT